MRTAVPCRTRLGCRSRARFDRAIIFALSSVVIAASGRGVLADTIGWA